MNDEGLWELSVYCVYYNVCREDMKPHGLCPVKMMSYAFFFLSAFVCPQSRQTIHIETKECLKTVHKWKLLISSHIKCCTCFCFLILFIPCLLYLSSQFVQGESFGADHAEIQTCLVNPHFIDTLTQPRACSELPEPNMTITVTSELV